LFAIGWVLARHSAPATVRGTVNDDKGPVSGARVRVQGQRDFVVSDRDGRFDLARLTGKGKRITAWKEGHVIAAIPLKHKPIKLALSSLPSKDHEDYHWVTPTPDQNKPRACGNCHGEIYREWSAGAHARSAHNRRLLNLVEGKDWHGRPSPTWSLKTEHPLGAAVCAACHAPSLRDSTLEYDLARTTGADAHGVHCDYCHKIVDAPTDRLGTRFGRDGLRLLRPPRQEQLFFGPLDDAFREGEQFAYSPLYKESRFCASCHEGTLFGVHVYGTYTEWLDSPARKKGQHCQSCHMKPTGTFTNIAPGKGGIDRDPQSLASHLFPGGQTDLLRRSLRLAVRLVKEDRMVRALVEVRAEDVGHRVPTGFIDRNLVLVVAGLDGCGMSVPLVKGTQLPAAAGKDLKGQPGWLYAKLLDGPDENGPVPFWRQHGSMRDTRLVPGQPDRRSFFFPANVRHVRVQLIYRRFWPDVARAKGWPDNDIPVVEAVAN
jgi:hypothetical protein